MRIIGGGGVKKPGAQRTRSDGSDERAQINGCQSAAPHPPLPVGTDARQDTMMGCQSSSLRKITKKGPCTSSDDVIPHTPPQSAGAAISVPNRVIVALAATAESLLCADSVKCTLPRPTSAFIRGPVSLGEGADPGLGRARTPDLSAESRAAPCTARGTH
ncbi:hypothetical protein JZ751_010326 [Albula glossodonta]|uniref:Uncharacterized protein n=1 Tax=Albula glossodonta TaxID=121402 RepID=A0A8T2NZT2_9TELE|nr:hypothetical protein JZ751_010326 [Albula glossodonta]